VNCSRDDHDRVVRIAAVEAGWLYTVQSSPAERIITFFTDGNNFGTEKRQNLWGTLATALRDLFDSSASLLSPLDFRSTAIVSATSQFCFTAYGRNWAVCGDAAQTLDPLSSSGISYAMADAINAANAVVRHFRGDDHCFYQRELHRRRRYLEYLRSRLSYYHVEQRWPHALFWSRRRDKMQLQRIVNLLQHSLCGWPGKHEKV
jgi:flavin-dependent dehydrogenase